MREIKFRAWDESQEAMDDVGEIRFKPSHSEPFILFNEFGKQIEGQKIMQFTGRKDIDGIELYEGDIVQEGANANFHIIRFGKYQRKQFMNGDSPQENYGFYLEGIPSEHDRILWNKEDVSMIKEILRHKGNIHANPEMIK